MCGCGMEVVCVRYLRADVEVEERGGGYVSVEVKIKGGEIAVLLVPIVV